MTYDGSSLRLYVNGQRDAHSLILSPGAVLFHWFLRLRTYELPGYKILYEALLFVPLGTLAGKRPTSFAQRMDPGWRCRTGSCPNSMGREFAAKSANGRTNPVSTWC